MIETLKDIKPENKIAVVRAVPDAFKSTSVFNVAKLTSNPLNLPCSKTSKADFRLVID